MRFWSRRQKAASLSSCEIDLYAAVSTGVEAVEALGLHTVLKDLGNNAGVTIAWRQPRGGGPHSTSGTWVGEARAHETSFNCKQRGMKAGGMW